MIGIRTPNAENDCSGTNYILEDHLIDITAPIASSHIYSSELTRDASAVCSSTIDTTEYFSVPEPLVLQSLEKISESTSTDACTVLQVYPDGGDTVATVDRGNSLKRRVSPDEDYSEDLEWETEKYFE